MCASNASLDANVDHDTNSTSPDPSVARARYRFAVTRRPPSGNVESSVP
ncbi:MAG TPA: hypothetical protein PLV93_09195 [Microthrixaceae bacterium]|nr:hypothetical protein [Microthrixaceae bacterium]HNI35563.1 hypothetical protein [Microthrixaceae bacterium]